MTLFDPYMLLGVDRDAGGDEIKAAYRRLARRLHPDANPSNPGAAAQFQHISAAYELLLDPGRRRSHDRKAASEPDGPALAMEVTPSKRAIMPLEEAQVIYLLVEIAPDQQAAQPPQRRDSRLNLTLVLDHSNSMNGARLDRVKSAAQQIIDQLGEHDVLSVIGFNDRATVIIPATSVTDKAALKARVSLMSASGGTEIFQGLQAGLEQNRRFLAPRLVNHILLLTDGNTFGDEQQSLELAASAAELGISISTMGLGREWNDQFLDELASKTGGASRFVSSSSVVARFLNDHIRSLSNIFAERVQLSIAPDPDIRLESAFKLAPSPQPMETAQGFIPVGSLQYNRAISALVQLEIPPGLQPGFRTVARIAASGDILDQRITHQQLVAEVSLEITDNPRPEDPPLVILDALARLTLYRMQERANEALDRGDIVEATRRLEQLATRLLELGQPQLAEQARVEAERVARTSHLSELGRKTLKYQTRSLLLDVRAEDKLP